MRTSVGSGTIYLMASSLFFMLSGYVINIWLGTYLGPLDYGVYGVVIALMTALNLMQSAGVPQAVSKYIAEDEANADAILKSGLRLQLGSTLALSVLFFLLASPLALLLRDPRLAPYIRASAFVLLPYSLMTLYLGYYNGLHFFKRQALIYTAYSFAKIGAIIGLVTAFRLYGAVAGFVLSPLLACLFGLRRPRAGVRRSAYAPLVRFSLPLVVFSVLSILHLSVDLLFVKALIVEDAAAGYYTAAQNIARIPYYGLSGLSLALFPSISRAMGKGLVEEARDLVRRSLRAVLLLLVPGALLMSATSRQLLQLLYSDEYEAAAGSLSILVLGVSAITLFTILSSVVSSAGNPRLSMLLAGAGLATTCLLCLAFVPRFGLEGAALATGVGGLCSALAGAVAVHRRFGVLVPAGTVLRVAAASLGVYALARLATVPVPALPLSYAALFGVYLVLLVVLGEFRREDWERARHGLAARTPFGGSGRRSVRKGDT